MKFLITILVNAVAVYLTAILLPGVYLQGFWGAIIVALVLALLNATLKPLLIILTIPATIFTFGLFLLVVNALVIMAADWLLDGFDVRTFWWALLFSLILSVINSLLEDFVFDKDKENDRRKW
ncbi:MAG: phage holin family protein [Chitinophagales bacterium]|nr:phage holin family protein [Chitinophagales bacterium]